MKTYKGIINSLPENGIFVFGSNTQGRHGAGAALTARTEFGAIYGQSKGLQGNSYAIVTKDLTKHRHPSIPQLVIKFQIQELYKYAEKNPDKDFYIAYGNGNNLNGYTPKEMAEMFSEMITIPKNIVFNEDFAKLLNN